MIPNTLLNMFIYLYLFFKSASRPKVVFYKGASGLWMIAHNKTSLLLLLLLLYDDYERFEGFVVAAYGNDKNNKRKQ